jgi:hypothetical protein
MKQGVIALAVFLALSLCLSAFGRYSYRPAYFIGNSFTIYAEGSLEVQPEIAPEYRANTFLSRDGALPEPYLGGAVQAKKSLTISGFGLLLRSLEVNSREIDWVVGQRHWTSPQGYSVRADQPVQRIIPGSISRSIGLFTERYIHALDVLCYAAIATLFIFSFRYPHLDMAYLYVGLGGTVTGALVSINVMGGLVPIGLSEEFVIGETMVGFATALSSTAVPVVLLLIKMAACPHKTWMWRCQG